MDESEAVRMAQAVYDEGSTRTEVSLRGASSGLIDSRQALVAAG